MGVKWTEEQQKVIHLRNCNLLVSAAAGSGKTAVLVERIITRLTKDEQPLDIDHMLIVTFTEAAAAEMKERIRLALEKALEQEPQNVHLKKQSVLIHTAKITTIHSFCLSVIRDYFHTIDLDPGFRIAEEGELKLLRQEVLKELLEQHYESGEETFLQFVEHFATGRDDSALENLILQVYDFARSYPEPEKWLAESVSIYENGMDDETVLMKRLNQYVQNCLQDIRGDMETAEEICQTASGPYMYEKAVCADKEKLEQILEARTYEESYHAFRQIGKWERMASNRDKSVDPEMAEYVKMLRGNWKTELEALQKTFFFQEPEEMQKDLEQCLPVMKVLTMLVQEFSEAFWKKKEEKNMLDFSDLEHLAVSILTRKENGVLVPSDAAKELQEQYEEIMIDEYQDSNLIQEAILTSVSRMSRGEQNLFMVGDVKQSIYRFRLSRPELFMEKYDTYSLEEGPCQRIDLHKNFRSRAEVLDFVNAVFRKTMTKSVGNIVYDDDAALYVGAQFETIQNNKTELLMIDTEIEEEEKAERKTLTNRELEARAIAGRIHGLMEEQQVWDKELEAFRPLEYRDIVILTRSLKGWADEFVRVLKDEGIPAYTDSKEGYFGTLEIGWMMDYLRVLDNHRQDIPLTAVLKSPFGRCTNEELAVIRSLYPEVPFYEAVLLSAGYQTCQEREIQPVPEELKEKLKRIFTQMETFRKKVPYTAIHDLLWDIMQETGFREYVSVMPGGEQRLANLEMLLVRAKAFESTSYKGLFHFIRYVEQMKEYDIDYGEADIFGEHTNAVRVMSIHKSKGLEFPVVFAAGMGKKFNMQDTFGNLIVHPELGIGISAIDLEKRTKSPTILKNLIQTETMLENLGEELRVLYVALTRAKEKLILTGTLKQAEEKLEKYAVQGQEEGPLSFLNIARARTYLDWVLPVVLSEKEDSLVDVTILSFADIVQNEMEQEEADRLEKGVYLDAILDAENPLSKNDEHVQKKLQEQFSYQYPKNENSLKMKYTVSELKKSASLSGGEMEMGERLIEEEISPVIPKFVKQEEPLTGASRGSVYHKVMELLDFARSYDEMSLEQELYELCIQGYLSEEMKACIWKPDILAFLKSDVGRRMQEAAKQKTLYREQPFVFGMKAEELNPEATGEDLVLIQGIIDAYFEEDKDLVVVDYKTDRVKNGKELVEKYQEQLNLYGKALEQITGKTVKEKVIYSFTLKEEIHF